MLLAAFESEGITTSSRNHNHQVGSIPEHKFVIAFRIAKNDF